MSFPQGINFRATSTYVTDGANETYEIYSNSTTPNYPRTTPQGNSVGWETIITNIQTRDRNSSNDRRLAGFALGNSSADTDVYRIDLPASGTYNLRAAFGDASYSRTVGAKFYDGSTLLGSISGSTGASNSYKDASNNVWTAANWPTSNVAASYSFATTIFRLKTDGTNDIYVTHVDLASSGGGGVVVKQLSALGVG